nr:RNA-dependent RNA polymerase [ssRNA positive-strand virus sp.]
MANASRSDPDWRYTTVRIFSKTQHKVNEGSLFGPWKACQTLALMHDAVILLFGPVKKYQRLFDAKDRPARLFIYGGHTPFQLSEFAQANIPDNCTSLTNDYTSFDQSQGGESVVLERLKMQRLSIPEHLVQLHCFLKTHVSTQFGPLTCMRLTGEPGTYDDNTDYNLAVLHLAYQITYETVMVSGDDSNVSPAPPPNPEWSSVAPMLSLKFKTELTKYPLFCGYFVGHQGAIRAPRSLFAKVVISHAAQTLPDTLASYLAEFSVGHSLGDDLWRLLPLDQVEYQAGLFDFFCRNASREQKMVLKIGEVPEETCVELLKAGFRFLARPLYALLNRAMRLRILSDRRNDTAIEDPELEGVLQHAFQL